MWERSAQTPSPPWRWRLSRGVTTWLGLSKQRDPNAARSPSRGSRPPPSAPRWPGPGLPRASRWSGCAAEALGGVELRRGRLPGGRGAMLSYPTACKRRSGRWTPGDSSSPGGDDGGRGGREGRRPPPRGHSPALRPVGWARGELAAREEPKRRRPDPEAQARSRRPRAVMTPRPPARVTWVATSRDPRVRIAGFCEPGESSEEGSGDWGRRTGGGGGFGREGRGAAPARWPAETMFPRAARRGGLRGSQRFLS